MKIGRLLAGIGMLGKFIVIVCKILQLFELLSVIISMDFLFGK